jgi:hypothetical protein
MSSISSEVLVDQQTDLSANKSVYTNIFHTPILQSFLVKSNLSINLSNLVDALGAHIDLLEKEIESCRSGTLVALKYKNTIRGKDDLFKTKTGFKNACHLIMCHTLDKRKKKMVQIKITAVGTFQVVGIPVVDVEKVVYKVFLLLEKINKTNDIFRYVSATKDDNDTTGLCPVVSHNFKTEEHNRLEIVIVPILNNYMLTLSANMTKNIFQNSKVQIIQKFIDNNFLSFMVPNDPAITIKKSFSYKDFSNHPIRYITWNKKCGKVVRHIEYDSYTTLLKDIQKENARSKKYLTLRLYSTGKVLVSGFDEILIQNGIQKFLSICDQF